MACLERPPVMRLQELADTSFLVTETLQLADAGHQVEGVEQGSTGTAGRMPALVTVTAHVDGNRGANDPASEPGK